MIHDAIGPKRKTCIRCRRPLHLPHFPGPARCDQCMPGYRAPKVGLIGPWDPAVHTAINEVHMAVVLGQLPCREVELHARLSSGEWAALARLEQHRREAL